MFTPLLSQWLCVFCVSVSQSVVPVLLEDVPLAVHHDIWFQHDGAWAYLGARAHQLLNINFHGRWTGCVSPVHGLRDHWTWSPWTSLLWTPEGTHLQGLIIWHGRLIEKLHAAMATSDVDILQQVQASIPWHAAACWQMQGRHFEHMMFVMTDLHICTMYRT
jgi:hypothetical protein